MNCLFIKVDVNDDTLEIYINARCSACLLLPPTPQHTGLLLKQPIAKLLPHAKIIVWCLSNAEEYVLHFLAPVWGSLCLPAASKLGRSAGASHHLVGGEDYFRLQQAFYA